MILSYGGAAVKHYLCAVCGVCGRVRERRFALQRYYISVHSRICAYAHGVQILLDTAAV